VGPEPTEDPATGPHGDLDGDGLLNEVEGEGDIDADGIPNREDLDTDGDGIPDEVEGLRDADGDGIADFVEPDDDGDGIPTLVEGSGDDDGDGIPNHRDAAVPEAIVEVEPEPPVAAIPEDVVAEELVPEEVVPEEVVPEEVVPEEVIPEEVPDEAVEAPLARLQIVVLTAPTIYAGEPTELVMEVVNSGSAPASAATAQMLIPDDLVVDSTSLADDCELAAQLLLCEVGELDIAEVVTRAFKADVSSSASVINTTAAVTADGVPSAASASTAVVLEKQAVAVVADGLKSEGAAMVIVVLTAIVCGVIILSATRRESVRRS
jgi:hypothetical protein